MEASGRGGDLIDHRPREGYLAGSLYISLKCLIGKTVLYPALCKSCDGSREFISVVGAVIHAYHGDRLLTCKESCIQKRCDLSDIAGRLLRTCCHICGNCRHEVSVRTVEVVTLFCDGKSCHLQGVCGENLLQAGELCIIIGIECRDSITLPTTVFSTVPFAFNVTRML